MELIDLKCLNLTTEESGDIIKFLAQRRGITTKKLLSTIKLNLKRKNNKDLTSKSQQELVKTQQKLAKTQLALIKSQRELIKSIKSQQKLTKQTKSQRELIKSQEKLKKKTQLRLIKPQQTLSNTKERIEFIREKLNELHNNFSKSELKEIRNHLYNIVNKNELENSNEYLNELDKKIIKLNEYNNNNNNNNNNNKNNNDFIENVRDLFNIVNYEPILIKTGFNNYYLEYRSEGNDSLSFEECINLIKPYLNDLINDKKDKG